MRRDNASHAHTHKSLCFVASCVRARGERHEPTWHAVCVASTREHPFLTLETHCVHPRTGGLHSHGWPMLERPYENHFKTSMSKLEANA